jgi:PadR family transcriptional regulator, regulatory protein PadR
MASDIELFPGTLDLLVLNVLTNGPLHGYAIVREIRRRGGEELSIQEGTLYPALHRMCRRGWIEAEWGPSETNRRAKYYNLTPAGRKALREEITAWERISAAVSQVLQPAPRAKKA